MPNHCVNAKNENAQASNIDYSVIFNRDVNGMTNYSESDLDSSAKTEELLCDLQRTAATNMMDGSGYTENSSRRMLQRGNKGDKPPPGEGESSGSGPSGSGPSGGGGSTLNTASGFAITGGPIFNALSGE